MQIYILTIDGHCFSKEDKTIQDAINSLWIEEYKGEDYEDFINEINLVEWKDQKNRYIKNYKNKKNSIESFDLESDFKLKEYLKIKPVKKPTRELEEEFEL